MSTERVEGGPMICDKTDVRAQRTVVLVAAAALALLWSGCAARPVAGLYGGPSRERAGAYRSESVTVGLTRRAVSDCQDCSHGDIHVHGQWTVEVRNPDGALVAHREFENALIMGQWNLATALGHTSSVGFWYVTIDGPLTARPCAVNGGCIMAEGADPTTAAYYFHTLTLSAPFQNSGNPNAGKLTLTGTATVQSSSAQITTVFTTLSACAPTVPPASCTATINQGFGGLGFFPFTQTSITPINVLAGQQVHVTVVFSFS